jgi:hypothetical protein
MACCRLPGRGAIGHYIGDFERVRRHAERALEIADPEAPVRHGAGIGHGTLATTLLGFASLAAGDSARANALFGESLAFLQAMLADGAHTPRWPYEIALSHAARGDTERAIMQLESAYDLGFRWTWMLQFEPMLATLRGDPRFQRLMERVRADVETNAQAVGGEAERSPLR